MDSKELLKIAAVAVAAIWLVKMVGPKIGGPAAAVAAKV